MLMKTVFVTGATGNMGWPLLKRLVGRQDIRLVVLASPKDRRIELLKEMERKGQLSIVCADVCDRLALDEPVGTADIIIHMAAVVSPAADRLPELAMEVNLNGTRNLLAAIKAQGREASVKLVFIGSVAETGDRRPPLHWGRVGDPVKPAMFDAYALSKLRAEREVVESGLSYWVSLRQTGIMHKGLLSVRDGIIFHQPLNNCMEWISDEDSAAMLEHIIDSDLPEVFWRHIYNVGGGEKCRLTYYEFMELLYKTIGIRDIIKVMEPSWFALGNFHGQYYLDSDILEDFLHFRSESPKDFAKRIRRQLPVGIRLSGMLGPSPVKRGMSSISSNKGGSLQWMREKEGEKIDAFYGSMGSLKLIPGWETWIPVRSTRESEKLLLSHGYDEGKGLEAIDFNDLKEIAVFRGGRLLSGGYDGDLWRKLNWECPLGHRFEASPGLIAHGGHFCPVCDGNWSEYDRLSALSPFFRQVYEPLRLNK